MLIELWFKGVRGLQVSYSMLRGCYSGKELFVIAI